MRNKLTVMMMTTFPIQSNPIHAVQRLHTLWYVISRSGVVISITNCYTRFTYLLTY